MLKQIIQVGAKQYLSSCHYVNTTVLTKISRILPIMNTCLEAKRFIGLQQSNEPSHAGTMSEVHEFMVKRLGIETGYHPIPKNREPLLKYQPKPSDLPSRSMQDSFTSAIIPLSSDEELQDRYISRVGRVRVGRLMEDMDMFAVWVCHKHICVPTLPENVSLPYTFVTILVDKVTFSDFRAVATEDLRLSGHVSWVGRSSMEVVVWLEHKVGDKYVKITRALFLMAARNATNTGPAPVNQLEPATEEEKKILAGGEERKKRRQRIQSESVFKVEPNDFEQTLMFELYKRTTHSDTIELNKRILPANCIWMSDSSSVSTEATFPENRNAHNKVFGGFLMRKAIEISFISAFRHCGTRPKLKHISDISFEKPIDVSSFIKMTAYVVYTEANYMQIMTTADILCGITGNQMTSNAFYLTYEAPDIVKEVIPNTYHETMWYIHGRRKFKSALESNI